MLFASAVFVVEFVVQTRYPIPEGVLVFDIQGKNYLEPYVIHISYWTFCCVVSQSIFTSCAVF